MGHKSRFGFVDRNNPEAAGECDRCGAVYKLRALKKQMRISGRATVWTGWLVCDRCLDIPQPQDRVLVLPPDPKPVPNPRPLLESPTWSPAYIMAENGEPLLDEIGVPILPEAA